MSTLIVDFPGGSNAKPRDKSVTFAEMADIRPFTNDASSEAATRKLFYSRDDIQVMKNANAEAVRELHKRYKASRSCSDSVEAFLTQTSACNIARRRQERCRAVLREQAKQLAEYGEIDPVELAAVSMYYSKIAVERANEIAQM